MHMRLLNRPQDMLTELMLRSDGPLLHDRIIRCTASVGHGSGASGYFQRRRASPIVLLQARAGEPSDEEAAPVEEEKLLGQQLGLPGPHETETSDSCHGSWQRENRSGR